MVNYRNFNTGIADKSERLMNTVAERCAFYRANPHRFVKDYLNIHLKIFQQIFINMMFFNNYVMLLAARGLSKTFSVAVFCVVRCILYPGTTVVVTSKTKMQAAELIKKIELELMPKSPNLRLEIKKIVSSGNDPICIFKNGSVITVTTASDTGRGRRGQILICDEVRLMSKDVIDTVLKNIITVERHPAYLDKEEYRDYGSERNKVIYMTSPWTQGNWIFKEAQSYVIDMFNSKKDTFVCGNPYQLAIKEGLRNKRQVEDEMAAVTFDSVKFYMECECLFWGESENAFFKYESLERARRIRTALYPQVLYSRISNKLIKPVQKTADEIRLLTIDIAVMSSKKNKNDASAIFILQLLPTKDGQYIRNVLYSEVFEGKHSRDQAMIVRRLFEQMDCDYIVIDANGVGMGIYDCLVDDMTDDVTGEFYPAFTCINDETMADHYKGAGRSPQKVIYSVKASAKFNSQCAYSLRDCIERGKLRLLMSEEDFVAEMEEKKEYQDLSTEDQVDLRMPYIQTSLLINELVNLEYTSQGTEIKIKETGSNRKDRYSSLAYGNQIANELERKLTRRPERTDKVVMNFRAPSCLGLYNRKG
jgi:hypothetical protein